MGPELSISQCLGHKPNGLVITQWLRTTQNMRMINIVAPTLVLSSCQLINFSIIEIANERFQRSVWDHCMYHAIIGWLLASRPDCRPQQKMVVPAYWALSQIQ